MSGIVINRTRIASESRNSLPADTGFASAGNAATLLEWLGSFWSGVYEDPEFIKDLQNARALRVAQLYLDLLENLKLQDRENAPVFHRERWHPIIIRKSRRNIGSDAMFKVTNDGSIVFGEQKHGVNDPYPPETFITVGGRNVNYKDMVVYPLDGVSMNLKSVACLTNNIANATTVLANGADFVILDGAIAVSASQDPFTGDHADDFPKFEIFGRNEENADESDKEAVLWACDAMFDRDFLYTALGYAMGLPTGSSEVYKRVVNAAWNAVSSGATPLLLRSLIACICGIPTVKEEGETVEAILDDMDGSIEIVTDKNVYSLPEHSELRRNVRRGAKLHRFDTLDKAIRVYACTTDAQRLPEYNDFLDDFDEFTEDVPSIDLPPALFRSDLERGFSVNWDLQDVIYCGNDANDNPKLRFSLGGEVDDEDKFWADTWASYEKAGKSMETCLEGISYDTIYTIGAAWCKISPMEFFMHNLIGANTIIVTVRTDTLADDAPLYDPKFFGVVRECIPSYARLYIVEHTAVPADGYKLSGGTRPGDGKFTHGAGATDYAEEFAYEEIEDRVMHEGRKKCMKMKDRTSHKWVASCRGSKDPYADDNPYGY